VGSGVNGSGTSVIGGGVGVGVGVWTGRCLRIPFGRNKALFLAFDDDITGC
jgi:hypothetical protein